ncbi:MAG: hypothetical protein K8I30_08995 [Anaerolineae bacterium]|nr:hypothetical protein [Anaerolineae bacterium]
MDRLREEFGGEIAFVDLNAGDDASGEQAFQTLHLPGHPGFVLFSAAGAEVDRAFGIVEENRLRMALQALMPTATP